MATKKKGNINVGLLLSFLSVGIALVVLIDLIIKNIRKRKAERQAEMLTGGTPAQVSQVERNIDFDKVLQNGSSGNEVRTLQALLLNDGEKLPRFGIDGQFGDETEAALFNAKGVRRISIREYIKD